MVRLYPLGGCVPTPQLLVFTAGLQPAGVVLYSRGAVGGCAVLPPVEIYHHTVGYSSPVDWNLGGRATLGVPLDDSGHKPSP